ncbi:hypothetical protein CONPUDRAFT_79583 [Coniophora puteana RWD-64-598 SS2]|uniref:Fanconi-associated nuclease n=1 Tax=Coniophora puteana (strain RWD-64-598) TaxID=741705 RepID=A0A5M3N071_CONPW|nr:uncharacterized protein CONPUDRAFT_79583 [Coniophora puteana RWD-64-598 SS2]EIW84813.1 hypothetical protein CONPUDRAFT_79583 [Coniophora puteana RWD-64-598 SS2]
MEDGWTNLVLAEDQTKMELRELLECLKKEELGRLAKEFKVQTQNKKNDIVSSLLSLVDGCHTASSTSASRLRQTTLSFGKSHETLKARLRARALNMLGRCVRVNEAFMLVVRRIHLIYFRMTHVTYRSTPDLLTPALLAKFSKRNYAVTSDMCKRSKDIWKTRGDLLAFEEAVYLEAEIDAALDGSATFPANDQYRSAASVTPDVSNLNMRFVTPVTPAKGGSVSSPLITPKSKMKTPKTLHTPKQQDDGEEGNAPIKSTEETMTQRRARYVLNLAQQYNVLDKWANVVKVKTEEGAEGEEESNLGLLRFKAGHVFARIVHKVAEAYGKLDDLDKELEILDSLLVQNKWRRGRRGQWHERKCIILNTHKREFGKALKASIEALQDPYTHIVYRPKLDKRTTTLEKKLKVPREDRHTCEGGLREPVKVTFMGIRLRHRAASLHLDRMGRQIKDASPKKNGSLMKLFASPIKGNSAEKVAVKDDEPKVETFTGKGKGKAVDYTDETKGKSIWLGRDSDGINVENFALQQYEKEGFKGVHCETSSLLMLFGLLFWDIIFAPIPGAFETPYQSAPLDIADDTFYHSRRGLIETRLSEIKKGEGPEIVARVDAAERERKTWCVGVKWDLFSAQDMQDIVTCLGGSTLSIICRILCEDYGGRCSGGPDLLLWNASQGKCKFVEVKGPGDQLSESQKLWIDLLARASADVEVCHVAEHDADPPKKKGRPKVQKKGAGKGKGKKGQKEPMDSEEEVDDAMQALIESENEPELDLLGDELPPPVVAQNPGKNAPRQPLETRGNLGLGTLSTSSPSKSRTFDELDPPTPIIVPTPSTPSSGSKRKHAFDGVVILSPSHSSKRARLDSSI